MTTKRLLRALLVDPSLFTAPYDAALTEGLVAAGVDPTWAVRPTRPGDRQEIASRHVDAFFYRHIDQLTVLPRRVRAVLKGLAHARGLAHLVLRVMKRKPDVVHFQWVVVPPLDVLAMFFIRWQCPLVLTVHDTVPFNGEHLSFWQNMAFDIPIKLSDQIIVHTRTGRDTLIRRGLAAAKVAVIPHGPLKLRSLPSAPRSPTERADQRWTFVLFGEIKPYKGIDVLIEAVGLLLQPARARARFIVAGRPRMDIAPLQARIRNLGLDGTVELRPRRLSEGEMAALFAETDSFLFPYRQVDASGVYYLVKSLGKWMIASKVGIFAEDLEDGVHGALIPPDNPRALAEAIETAIVRRFVPPAASPSAEWTTIGSATRDVYERTKTPKNVPRWFGLALAMFVFAVALGGSRRVSAQPATVQMPATPFVPTAERGYRLVKNWDFASVIRDEGALRAEFYTRYVYENGSLDHLNDEWSRFRDDNNHVFTPEGLALVARTDRPSPGGIDSGMLRSRWTGRYGVFEIRMKVPSGRGLWPAFWLNPEDQKWPPEIDVVEIVNNGRDTTRQSFHFLHGIGAKNARETFSKLDHNKAYAPGLDYADAFHVFSCEWTADRVRHFVDGTLVVEREYHWLHDDGSDGGPAHVLVGLAVGGNWPGPPTRETRFPARLDIDYIRVWQR